MLTGRAFCALLVSCVALLGSRAIAAEVPDDRMRAVKKQDIVLIRSAFYGGKDLLIRIELGLNGQINSRSTVLVDSSIPMTDVMPESSVMVHGNGDDAAPWLINGTFIGGNHGAEGVCEVTSENHGLATADLGSGWKDEAGNTFYLLKIVSADTLWFLGENQAAAPFWKFQTTLAGRSLTNALGKRTLSFSKSVVTQLRPACRIRKQEYLADGKTPLVDGKITECGSLEIAEEYDIINPGALLADIIAHPGSDRSFIADHLEAVLRNTIIYRFQANGSCVIETKSTALQAFHVGRAMFVMTAPLTTHGNSYSREYYIPKTRPFILEGRAFDFRGIQRFDEKPPAAIEFLADGPCLEDPKNLPERFVQFLGREENGRTRRDVGFALGYSLVDGITRPEVRADRTHNAGMIHTSLKSYPIAIDSKMGLIPTGMEFHCVGYRNYFSPQRYPEATSVYWHAEGKDIMLYADYHQKLEHTVVKLPPEFTGLKISMVEKTPSVTLHTKEVVPSAGIDLSIAESYGYVVLRLSHFPQDQEP
jgi:hypothetical protein